ncbi:hypothetical protein Ahy_B08g089263 [Arachis hypogaea]|uniref:CCHC-type domain-containing protein n=1 Tax=Arachis hypogaea TaxID=3818 RepID=A0A444XX43_ARAHY|nr:hypothetical protein Ahy_B08g089263 [Arachis hypogaea]
MKKKMSQKEVNKGSKTTKVSKTNNKPHVGPTTDGPHIRQSDDIGPKFSGPSAARHNHAGSSGGGPRMAGANAIDGDSGNVEERATVEEGHVDGGSIPCVHALAAIARRGDRPEGYVHPLLKIGAARATYQPCIQPVNSEEYWDKIEVINPIPPKLKRPIGRPVKRRKKEPSENETSGSKVKKTFRVTCSKCGETGHNQKTCKGPAAPNRRSTKLRRTNSGATIPHSARAKQPIVRPHYPAPVQSSTPPPIPPPRPSQGVSAATITAASKGTTSRMFQFIPNPGFKHPRQNNRFNDCLMHRNDSTFMVLIEITYAYYLYI